MARSRLLLHEILVNLMGGDEDPEKKLPVYFQPPTSGMEYPCIKYERATTYNSVVYHADDLKYLFYKAYDILVIDRNPDSLIPDQVEALPHSRFDRSFVVDGLNHFAFHMFF